MPQLFVQTLLLMLNSCLPFVKLELWYIVRQRCLHAQPLIWTLVMSLEWVPCWTTFHSCCHDSLLEELNVSYLIPPWEDSWKVGAWFFWTLYHRHLPFTNFALHPFVVINHCHEYNYIQICMNSPRKSLNLEVFLEILDTIVKEKIILTLLDSDWPPRIPMDYHNLTLFI